MDPIAEWTAAVERVSALVADLDAGQAEQHVPATPAWTVRELLAHMIGLDADILADDHPDDHNAEWTQRQVEARAGVPIADLLAEWQGLVEPMQGWMRANNPRPLGDVIIHEQDLRGALGVSGAQDTEALLSMGERMTERLAGKLGDLPPIALLGENWQWCSAGDAADAAVEVRASDFNLVRAVMARRSAAQLRRWTSRGDVDPYLEAFSTLGPLPMVDLTE